MNTKDELRNFLVFSYFGEEYDEMHNNKDCLMIQKCCERAYLDLSRTIDYFISTSELNDKKETNQKEKKAFEDKKDEFKNKIYEYLKKAIISEGPIEKYIKKESDLLGLKYISTETDFKDWHNNICEGIIQISQKEDRLFKTTQEIKYGQAQKWLNMTLKYLLLLGYWDDNETNRLEKLFHVPVDSYIMEAANEDFSVGIPKDKVEGTSKYSASASKKWSKWDIDEYNAFQEAIKFNSKDAYPSPLNWECPAWIKIAKKRNKHVKQNCDYRNSQRTDC